MAGREAEWESRWWSPIINAEHLAMRDRAAMFDLSSFCVFDVLGPGALDCVQQVCARQMDVQAGKVVYTPVLTAARRLPLRPHRHAPRSRALPRGHRRRARHGGPQVVRRPRRPRRAGGRPHLELVHARPVGPPRAGHRGEPHARRPLARGLPVRDLPDDRDGAAARARLAHLLRRRPRLGAVRADGAGRAAVGPGRGGGPAARDRARRHRRLRDHGAAGEVLPRLRLRAGRRVRCRRGRDGVVEGEGPGLRRQGGARAPARGGSGRRSCARSPSTTTLRATGASDT